MTTTTIYTKNTTPTPIQTNKNQYQITKTKIATNILSNSSTKTIKTNTITTTTQSTHINLSREQIDRNNGHPHQHNLQQNAEHAGHNNHIVVLRLNIHHPTIQINQLHPHRLPTDINRHLQPLEHHLTHDNNPQTNHTDLHKHHTLQPITHLNIIQTEHVQSVHEPTLLHQNQNQPNTIYIPTLSTTKTTKKLTDGTTEPIKYNATLYTPLTAEQFKLQILTTKINNNTSTITQFVLIRKPKPIEPPSDTNKTTIIIFQHDNHPNNLLKILKQFTTHKINLSQIKSQPTSESLNQYYFSINYKKHINKAQINKTLINLHHTYQKIHFLNSYPQTDTQPIQMTTPTTNTTFAKTKA